MALMPYQPTILDLGDGDVEPQFIISKQKKSLFIFSLFIFSYLCNRTLRYYLQAERIAMLACAI